MSINDFIKERYPNLDVLCITWGCRNGLMYPIEVTAITIDNCKYELVIPFDEYTKWLSENRNKKIDEII